MEAPAPCFSSTPSIHPKTRSLPDFDNAREENPAMATTKDKVQQFMESPLVAWVSREGGRKVKAGGGRVDVTVSSTSDRLSSD